MKQLFRLRSYVDSGFATVSPKRAHERWAVVCVAVAIGLLPAAAQANTPIISYSAVPGNTQAGGHPDLEVRFDLSNRFDQFPPLQPGGESQSACQCEDAKDATVHLPAGFIGNPHATPQCTIAEFSSDTCPIDSQVGIVNVIATNSILPFDAALYNLVPPPDVAGLLGFKIFLFDTPQFTVLSARTGSDYGLDATATSIFHGVYPLQTFQEVLWGVPADPSHDFCGLTRKSPEVIHRAISARSATRTEPSAPSIRTRVQIPCDTNFTRHSPVPSNSPLTPFLQNPTTCALAAQLLARRPLLRRRHEPRRIPLAADDRLRSAQLQPQPLRAADHHRDRHRLGNRRQPQVPQQLSPTIPSPTELRGATVTLPPGFSINPNAADGKTACSDAEAKFGTEEEAHCPEFSKVGSLEIDSSALPGPLPGFVYLGEPLPGNRYRIFLVADGFATHVKLAGTVTPDPVTGQLVITFTNLPQSPLTAFNMHFFGSERGLLATPTQCGTYPVTTTFTPWDSSLGTQTSTQFFTLDSGPDGAPCPGPQRPFNPSFSRRRVRQHRRRSQPLHARTHPHRRRSEPQRAQRHHSARLLARP